MITASPIARCPSFKILHDADVAFGISGAELRTVLSATTMLADSRTASTDELACSDFAIFGFDDLASGYRTHGWATRAAGYRAAI